MDIAAILDPVKDKVELYVRKCKEMEFLVSRERLITRDSVPSSPVTPPGSISGGFFSGSGKLAEYPSWKGDWNQLVHPRLDKPT